jgi:hypothetical protein
MLSNPFSSGKWDMQKRMITGTTRQQLGFCYAGNKM